MPLLSAVSAVVSVEDPRVDWQ